MGPCALLTGPKLQADTLASKLTTKPELEMPARSEGKEALSPEGELSVLPQESIPNQLWINGNTDEAPAGGGLPGQGFWRR